MILFRITRTEKRATDLSGMGAFKEGGRWNSHGTYMLYTSENSSLAFLENLVYFEQDNTPSNLFLMSIDLKAEDRLVYTLPIALYPKDWMEKGNLQNKLLGDQLMADRKYVALKIRSAVNPYEFNVLLNPLFPRYHELMKINSVERLKIDSRLSHHQ